MQLSEVFSQLSYGELSQLSIGSGEMGVIDSANYDRMLSHVNLGLTTLYKRFPLKEGRLTLALQSGRVTYPLNSSFAVSKDVSVEPVRYILDSEAARFVDDIHKVERVLTSGDWELGLNDEADIYAVATPSAQVLRVPSAIVECADSIPKVLHTKTLTVVYRANHPILKPGVGLYDASKVALELPYSHLEPLLLYIASRVNNPIGMSNEFNAGNNYAAKYEAACAQLEQFNLRVDQGSHNTRAHRNGWI